MVSDRQSAFVRARLREVRGEKTITEFAKLLGVSERTLENWEQGRSKPSGAARSLLHIAARNPKAVLEALR